MPAHSIAPTHFPFLCLQDSCISGKLKMVGHVLLQFFDFVLVWYFGCDEVDGKKKKGCLKDKRSSWKIFLNTLRVRFVITLSELNVAVLKTHTHTQPKKNTSIQHGQNHSQSI